MTIILSPRSTNPVCPSPPSMVVISNRNCSRPQRDASEKSAGYQRETSGTAAGNMWEISGKLPGNSVFVEDTINIISYIRIRFKEGLFFSRNPFPRLPCPTGGNQITGRTQIQCFTSHSLSGKLTGRQREISGNPAGNSVPVVNIINNIRQINILSKGSNFFARNPIVNPHDWFSLFSAPESDMMKL
jgi:hypothetical protein